MAILGQDSSISRRALLGGAAGAAGLAGLAACGSGGSGGSGGGVSEAGTAQTPTFVPFADTTPDKPGTAEGVSPVFYNFPNPPVNREGYPLPEGEPFTALMQALPPEIPPEENKNYQRLYTEFGRKFSIVYGTYVDYREKFQVTMASGDLPDMMMMMTVPQMPKMLEKSFADLSDHLGGDNIKDYPGLANIPTPTWKIPTLNGRIWGIAQPRPPAGIVITSRGDVMAKRGIDDPNLKLADGKEFVEMMKQLTNKGKNEFAMGADPLGWLINVVKTMVGTPNIWKEEGGKFTHEIETEEMEMALSESGKMLPYLHPNSFSDTSKNAAWRDAGVTALYVQSFVGWGGNARNHPEWNVGNIEIPKWEGGGMASIRKSVAGYGSYVAFKKADDDRIKELLKIADYIASPFGTEQYLNINYGTEDYSYTMEKGNPTAITDAPPIASLTYTGGNSGAILYGQGVEKDVDAQHDYLSRAIPAGTDDASLGLYSETAVTDAATMMKAQEDVMREVMQGTKPMSEWRAFVKRWQSQVGDKMREEYAEAAAKQ